MKIQTALMIMAFFMIFMFILAFGILPSGYIPGTTAWKDRIYCEERGMIGLTNHFCGTKIVLESGVTVINATKIPIKL